MAPLPWRSRFVYGTGGDEVTWTVRLTTPPWDPGDATIGGVKRAAGGVQAGYVVRTDYLVTVRLRLYEDELPDMHALLDWAREGGERFLWYPDASESTGYMVDLEHPQAGERFQPIRSQEFPLIFEAELVLRRVADEPWPLEYFTCEE